MAKLVYGLNQSLDGYVDHLEFKPSTALRVAEPAEMGRVALVEVGRVPLYLHPIVLGRRSA
jgi:hypothetical protein